MRKLSAALIIYACLALGFAFGAESAKQPAFGSQKPLYLKVALAEDGLKLLSVVLDESKGTGSGYDVLYADADLNGAFDEAEKVTAKTWKCSPTGLHCDFPAVKVSVAPKSEALGKSCGCEITLNYAKHTYATEVTTATSQGPKVAASTTTSESFGASSNMKVGEGAGQWEYSFWTAITPSEKIADAPVWNFLGTPKLALTSKADDRNPGQLGIGLKLMAGETRIDGKKGTTAINARVEVRKPDGKVVHKDEGPADKYGFG